MKNLFDIVSILTLTGLIILSTMFATRHNMKMETKTRISLLCVEYQQVKPTDTDCTTLTSDWMTYLFENLDEND